MYEKTVQQVTLAMEVFANKRAETIRIASPMKDACVACVNPFATATQPARLDLFVKIDCVKPDAVPIIRAQAIKPV